MLPTDPWPESLRRATEVAGARFKAGDISASDRAQIEIQADRFALDADTARHTARAAVEGEGAETIADAVKATGLECEQIGGDLLISARMRGW